MALQLSPVIAGSGSGGAAGSVVIGTTRVTGGTLGSILFVGAATVIQQDNANLFYDDTQNFVGFGTNAPVASLEVMQAAATSGTPIALEVDGGAHTTLAATIEAKDVYFNLARTVQYATGTVSLQRAVYIAAPTYAAVGASVISTAAGLYVDQPVAGTNMTLNNAYAIYSNGLFVVNRASQSKQISFLGSSSAISSIVSDVTNGSVRLTGNRSAGSAGGINADVSVGSNIARTAGGTFSVLNNGVVQAEVSYMGGLTLTQSVGTSTAVPALTITNANHTGQTLSTEVNNIVSSAYTRTWATGPITTQREVYIGVPTYAFVGASTVTTAVGLEVEAPVAGTNATFTNTYAARFNGSVNITTATQMLILNNTTGSLSTILNPNSGSAVRIQGFRSAANTGGVTADVSVNTTTARTVGSTFSCLNNGSLSFEVMYYGGLLSTQRVAITGVAQALSTVPANHTGQTLSTEISNVNFPAYTRQWATGTITTQREVLFGQPTYAFVGASTITTAATLVVEGPPVAGTNATITTPYAFWVQAGVARFEGKASFDATLTAGGTTGAQTINKPTGSVNFAAAATTLVVTNNLVTTSSLVFVQMNTNDTTALIKDVEIASGSFTIRLQAAATAETKVSFLVIN